MTLLHYCSFPAISFRATACCLCLVFGGNLLSYSQDAESEDVEEEVFTLTPFEVTTGNDAGYLSTNSTAGTSLNMLIRDIPMSLAVINREMLDDIQATDLNESLIYEAGVFTDNYRANSTANATFEDNSPSAIGNFNDPFQNNVSIRGYNVPNQQRSGFRIGFVHNTAGLVIGGGTDGILTERTEIVRGPQSILYGINVLSGVTNIVPKRPQAEFSGKTSFMIGSDNEMRATLDVTGPIIKNRLNYRVMAAHQEFDDHMQVNFRKYERQTYGMQFDYYFGKRTRLFLEYVHSNRESSGVGQQFFQTAGNIRNKYGEAFQFGRDDPRMPIYIRDSRDGDGSPTDEVYDVYFQDHDLTAYGGAAADGVQDGPFIPKPGNEAFYDFSDRGQNFNISGPDTYRNQTENNILAQLYHSFTDNLNLELGVYHTKVDIEERNVSLNTFWNSSDTIVPGVPRAFPPESNWKEWQQNPEVIANDGLADEFGYGVGEAFVFGGSLRRSSVADSTWWETIYLPPDPADVALSKNTVQRVYSWYNWYDKPGSAESMQLRARLAYDIESEFLKIPAKHTFVAGASYIKDDINYIQGIGSVEQYYSAPSQIRISTYPVYPGKLETDPVVFRNSVFDTSVIRLGENDTIPVAGAINYGALGGLSDTGNGLGGFPSAIARSGHHEDTLYFRGYYGIYQGQFWNDKLTIIAGARHDSYQGKEREQLAIIDRSKDWEQYLSGTWLGSNTKVYDTQLPGIYGNRPWVDNPNYSDELNQRIADSIDLLRYTTDADGNVVENMPNGTIRDTFERSQTFNTSAFGVSYRIIESLSIYVAYSEGVFPNVGIRDGADNAIGPEETKSKEIGFRFDFLDGKISGTISFWQINRENAVTNWQYAPRPAQYYGMTQQPSDPGLAHNFSPTNTQREFTQIEPAVPGYVGGHLDPDNTADAALVSPYKGGQYIPLTYGIDIRYIELAMEELGYPAPDYGNSAVIGDFLQFNQNGEFFDSIDAGPNISNNTGSERRQWFIINYDKALRDADPETSVLKRAFDLAMQNADIHGPPTIPGDVYSGELVPYNGAGVFWTEYTNGTLNNASSRNYSGIPVTFTEEGKGIDGQIIFTPIPPWQIVFSFSHQKRGLVGSGINLVDPIAPDGNGDLVNWGTEYDIWVYLLGVENFADPSRPSTYNGDSVRGMDLSFVPQTSMGLLTRYSFKNGVLEGLTIGAGMQYESDVQTYAPIGGDRLAANIYRPPNRPERYVFNSFARYSWNTKSVTWSVQLNVNNIFDNKEDDVVAEYVSELDTPIYRRTRVLYTPRVWRLAVSAKF